MPDYNPDREGQADHKFIVQSAWPNSPKEIQTSKGVLKANAQGRMIIKDEVLAREIQKEHPRDLAVTRMRMPKPADVGHRYFFGSLPAMPWKRQSQEVTDGDNKRTENGDSSGNGSDTGDGEGGRPIDGEGAACEHE